MEHKRKQMYNAKENFCVRGKEGLCYQHTNHVPLRLKARMFYIEGEVWSIASIVSQVC